MGEIADGLINGDFDFYTGEYLGRGLGFPRTHDRPLPWKNRSKKNPTNGVMIFLSRKGLTQNQQEAILRKYAELKNWDIQGKHFFRKISAKIGEDWPAFASWAGNYIAQQNKQK